jgi:hypothetical protein
MQSFAAAQSRYASAALILPRSALAQAWSRTPPRTPIVEDFWSAANRRTLSAALPGQGSVEMLKGSIASSPPG